MLKTLVLGVLGVALIPVYFALLALYLLLWFLATVTGLGPFLQWRASLRDRALLATTVVKTSPPATKDPATPDEAAVVEYVQLPAVGAGQRKVAVRWSPGHGDPRLPLVAIPNGLGATLFTIGLLHDLLEAKGYPVLSYDRAGVGLSDPLPKDEAYSADQLVADLKALLDHYGGEKQWVLVGPSMGSIVSQAFLAMHPGQVLGFLNMDGLPFPFVAKKNKFLAAGKIYCLSSCLTYTGVIRPLLALATKPLSALASKHFSVDMIRAQMNEPNFYESIHREMVLMMELCAQAAQAWGEAFDIGALNAAERDALVNAPPTACGDAVDAVMSAGTWQDLPRAPVEVGSDWASAEETNTILRRLLARAAQQQKEASGDVEEAVVPLWTTFQNLVVRVMSARNYDFGMASSFYDREMMALSAAEHNLHAHLAADGKRLVFPTRSHDKMFFGLTGLIAAQVDDIVRADAKRKGLSPPSFAQAAVAVEGKGSGHMTAQGTHDHMV